MSNSVTVIDKPQKIGLVTAKTHRNKVIVLLNGKDVTNISFAADDVSGYVDIYKLTQDGRKYKVVGESGMATERLYGDVVIRLRE